MQNKLFSKPLKRFVRTPTTSYGIILLLIIYIIHICGSVFINTLVLYILPKIIKPDDYIIYALYFLAISDLVYVFITIPYYFVTSAYVDWFLGYFMCKFLVFVSDVNIFSAIYTIVYIAFDRYITICYPSKFLFLKGKQSCLLSLISIWIVHSILLFPEFFYDSIVINPHIPCYACNSTMPSELHYMYSSVFHINFAYIVPVILLFFFQGSILFSILRLIPFNEFLQNREYQADSNCIIKSFDLIVVKLSIIFSIFFILFHFPYFMWKFSVPLGPTNDVKNYVKFLSTMNTALNPWFYPVYLRKFRIKLKKVIFSCFSRVSNKSSRETTIIEMPNSCYDEDSIYDD